MPRTTCKVGPRPKRGTNSPAFAAALLCLAAALLLALTAGCAGEETMRRSRPSYDDSTALEFYERSVQELARGEYVPALTDVHWAERLCRAKDLRVKISRHKADILNHVHVFTTVEERSTLRYTLLYSEGDVYRPMGGLEVKFAFLEGEGIIVSSGATDSNGTSRGVIEKITSLRRKVVVEAAPAVHLDEGPVIIGGLKREFVLSRKHASQRRDQGSSERGSVIDFIHSILDDIFNWKVTE